MTTTNVRMDEETTAKIDTICNYLGLKTRTECARYLVNRFWRDTTLQEMA